MGEQNTRIQEFRRDLDGLQGSFEGITGTMEELRRNMDEKLTQSMEEFKRILLINVENQRPQMNPRTEDELATAPAKGRREEEYRLPTRRNQLEFSKFDGTILRDWLYQCEHFFEVDETPEASKIKLASCRLGGKTLQWHQVFMKTRLSREWPSWENI